MVKIKNEVLREQKSFWNGCVFHPTDAVEDPWGRRILDQVSQDGAIDTVRVYSMFEDMVYYDGADRLCYDFRLSDLRLDYLTEKGFKLIIAYAGIPDCIASSTANKTSVSKGKTRYKGKMWNSAPPRDYALWEEICYQYTKHNIERYGIETVAKWRCQCFNEPDVKSFWLSQLDADYNEPRLAEYCKLYDYFQRGVRRASEEVSVGGPAFGGVGSIKDFFGGFLQYAKEHDLKIDFATEHKYSVAFHLVRDKKAFISVENMVKYHEDVEKAVREHGCGDLPIVMDEWGMISHGFRNIEDCPDLMCRESEVFSAFYVKMIRKFLDCANPPEATMICLSGQHEMEQDFTGFRNFFTLNFIRKPIYNAHVLAGRLKEKLLCCECENENLFVVPTTDGEGGYAVLASYCSPSFGEDIPPLEETLDFDGIKGKQVTVWCIDKTTTNPCRTWERAGKPEMTEDFLAQLRREGKLKPVTTFAADSNSVKLAFTPNSTYFVAIE